MPLTAETRTLRHCRYHYRISPRGRPSTRPDDDAAPTHIRVGLRTSRDKCPAPTYTRGGINGDILQSRVRNVPPPPPPSPGT